MASDNTRTNEQSVSGTSKARSTARHLKEETIAGGRWLNLNLITYCDAGGKERTWESASRTTAVNNSIDAVTILPLLRRTLHVDCVVCIKQYRPPVKAYTIEFPAGLIDEGESLETCALRELKEETGYTGRVKHKSPATCLDSGTESCCISIVTAEIDGDLPENMHPQQNLDDTESIEVITIPLSGLLDTLNGYSAQGVVVDTRVYSYAIAHEQFAKAKAQEEPSRR